MLTQWRLKELLSYEADTGKFIWRINASSRARAGDEAGCLIDGYRYIRIDGPRYSAHRLAWFYVYGVWPKNLIDHKDQDRSNNRLENLREATHSFNKANRTAPANNKSGYKGVSFSKANKSWVANICKDRKLIYLGSFSDKKDAAAAYAAKAHELFGEYACP